MPTSITAQRYAQALFAQCLHEDQLTPVYQDMQTLQQILEESENFKRFLKDPVLPSAKRKTALNDLFAGKAHHLTLKFLLFLEENKRLSLLEETARCFLELCLEHNNVLKVKVTTKTTLEHPDIQTITDHLSQRFNKHIDLSLITDNEIIGGIKLQMGNRIYDYTIQSQLERFRKNIISQPTTR